MRARIGGSTAVAEKPINAPPRRRSRAGMRPTAGDALLIR
jgi:hypothetical protein